MSGAPGSAVRAALFVVAACIASACTSGTSSTSGGNGGGGGAEGTARAIVAASIAAGTNPAAACPETGSWVSIGSFGGDGAAAVAVVDADEKLNSLVECTVAQKADGRFDVSLKASTSGGGESNGMDLTGVVSSSGAQTVAATFRQFGAKFSGSDCTLTLATAAAGQAIAPGRIWADVICARAVEPMQAHTCELKAQVRFENCIQN